MGCQSSLVLILTNSDDATTDFLEEAIEDNKVELIRIDTDHLDEASFRTSVSGGMAQTQIMHGDSWLNPSDLNSVYFRRPILPKLYRISDPVERNWARQEFRKAWGGFLAQVPAYKWINHPSAITQSSYKPEQLARASRFELRIPETLISTDPSEARSFCERLKWNVIAKPVGYGEAKDKEGTTQEIVYTNKLTRESEALLSYLKHCPAILQENIKKSRDIRVTIVDDIVISVALHSQEQVESMIDCRRDNMSGMRYSLTKLPSDTEERLVNLVRSYGLRFSAIDLVEGADGDYWFLELNPVGQWAWLEQKANAPISEALQRSFQENMGSKRLDVQEPLSKQVKEHDGWW